MKILKIVDEGNSNIEFSFDEEINTYGSLSIRIENGEECIYLFIESPSDIEEVEDWIRKIRYIIEKKQEVIKEANSPKFVS